MCSSHRILQLPYLTLMDCSTQTHNVQEFKKQQKKVGKKLSLEKMVILSEQSLLVTKLENVI